MTQQFETVLFEKSPDKVATITINRPERGNSFTRKMCDEFQYLWKAIDQDPDVNAVVIRAAEGRAFSVGVDSKMLGALNTDGILLSNHLWGQRDPGEALSPKFNHCWKPVVCAVHGICAGGALYWLNEADVVICSPEAQFLDTHVTFGMTAAVEPIGLRWRIPLPEILRMFLMGNDERLSAETALRISLVTEIVERDQLWARAHEIAAAIAAKPTAATQGTVRAIWESLEMPRTIGINNALKYVIIGNPEGEKEIDLEATLKRKHPYRVR
jgi:enoyl-CoA hydratase/carnithine racemase